VTSADRLRAMREKATSGPWSYEGLYVSAGGEPRTRSVRVADAALIALAPDLAEWAADAAEMLARIEPELLPNHDTALALARKFGLDASAAEKLVNELRELLARLAEIVPAERTPGESDENLAARVEEAQRLLQAGDETALLAYLTGASEDDIRKVVPAEREAE
jgi:hypothetical protein